MSGYQVLSNWLKEPRDRVPSLEEIKTHRRVVTAIGKTIEIQQEIDALYPEVEKEIIRIALAGKN